MVILAVGDVAVRGGVGARRRRRARVSRVARRARRSVRPTVPPVRGMAHATRRDGVTRGRGVTPVGRARARGGRRPHAGDAGVFQTVRRRARSRRAAPRRTTPPGGGAAVLGAAVLDAADDLAAGLFEMDSLVAAAVASARGVRDDVEWLRVRADARARVACRVASLGSLRHFLASARARDARVAGVDGSNPTEPHRANHARRFRLDGRRAYPTESELGAAARDARAALSRAYAAADAADARGEGATTTAMLAAAPRRRISPPRCESWNSAATRSRRGFESC